jgi:hypothetical protein
LLDETMLHLPNGGDAMRLIHRHRHHGRAKAPRIAISQAEITADLHYPAATRSRRQLGGSARRGGR